MLLFMKIAATEKQIKSSYNCTHWLECNNNKSNSNNGLINWPFTLNTFALVACARQVGKIFDNYTQLCSGGKLERHMPANCNAYFNGSVRNY